MRSTELREAAALMRERAEAASSAPWAVFDASQPGDPSHWHVDGDDGQVTVADTGPGEYGGKRDAEYIASMHPAVALAVADLLDEQADIVANSERAGLPIDHDARLFMVARTYLGRQS